MGVNHIHLYLLGQLRDSVFGMFASLNQFVLYCFYFVCFNEKLEGNTEALLIS